MPAPQTPLGDGDERVQYVGPDTYIFGGDARSTSVHAGHDLRRLPCRLEAFAASRRGGCRPRYAIDRVVFKGRARDRHAELQCEITVRLLTEEPVDVPLGMAEAILQGEARFTTAATGEESDGDQAQASSDGDQSDYLDYDPQRGGFVARFAAGSSQLCAVTLSLLVPLLRDAAGNSLSLTCPRTASSSLTLDVDADVDTEADVTSGVITAQETISNGTHLVIAGAMGPFRLTWRTPEAAAGAFATVLNSQAVRVAIDGRSVRTNARLTVQSYGGSFDRLRVQLPCGAQLIQDRATPSARRKPRLPHFPRAVAARCRSAKRRYSPPGCVGGISGQAARTCVYRFDNRTADRVGERLDGGAGGHGSFGAVRQFGDVLPLVQPLDGELGSHHITCPRTRRFTVSLGSSADRRHGSKSRRMIPIRIQA